MRLLSPMRLVFWLALLVYIGNEARLSQHQRTDGTEETNKTGYVAATRQLTARQVQVQVAEVAEEEEADLQL